jgi:hypothetical protein
MFVSMLAVFAVSAVASATASATNGQWYINGSKFTSGSETITASGGPFVLKSTAGTTKTPIEIECKTVSSTGSNIKASFTDAYTTIVFSTCTVLTPTACKTTATITTTAGTTELFDNGTDVWDTFTPTGGTFVTITITGCALENNYKVNGCASGKIVAPTTEAVTKELKFGEAIPAAAKCAGLTFGANEATLTGTAKFALSGTNKGKNWTAKIS